MTPDPILFIDLETTGRSAVDSAPLSIACYVLGGPNHGAEFHHQMRPHKGAMIYDEALKVNNFTREEIIFFPDPYKAMAAFQDFIQLLDTGHSLSDSKPIYTLGGWCVHFDESFMRAWIGRTGEASWYGNTFSDTRLEASLDLKSCYPDYKQRFGGYKLVNVYAGLFGRPLDKAHTAHADVLATRDVFLHCDQKSGKNLYQEYHNLLPQ